MKKVNQITANIFSVFIFVLAIASIYFYAILKDARAEMDFYSDGQAGIGVGIIGIILLTLIAILILIAIISLIQIFFWDKRLRKHLSMNLIVALFVPIVLLFLVFCR